MAFMALWRPDLLKTWLWYQLGGLLAGLVLYLGLLQLNSALLPSSGPSELHAHSVAGRPMMHSSGRSMLWRLAAEDALENPLLGSGPTRYACDSEYLLPAHPHSFPLRIVGEMGFIAGFLLFFVTTWIGWNMVKVLQTTRNLDSKNPPIKILLATSLIAGAIHSCVSGLLIMPASQVLMVMVAGWALGLHHRDAATTGGAVTPKNILTAGLLAAMALLSFSYYELPRLEERTAYAKDYGVGGPRFWRDGRVCEYSYGS
jgi:O-antigen ligase